MQLAYYGHYHCPADGRIYVVPRCATQAAFFDTATKTWETFGDTFPKSQFMENDKWMIPAVSSIDNCMYSFPFVLNDATRILKIDPTHATAKEVGEDLRPPAAHAKRRVTQPSRGEMRAPACGHDVKSATKTLSSQKGERSSKQADA